MRFLRYLGQSLMSNAAGSTVGGGEIAPVIPLITRLMILYIRIDLYLSLSFCRFPYFQLKYLSSSTLFSRGEHQSHPFLRVTTESISFTVAPGLALNSREKVQWLTF